MGTLCVKKQKIEIKIEQQELTFKEYKSSFDKYYTEIEQKYIYLKYFQLYEFLVLLTNYQTRDHLDHCKDLRKNHEINGCHSKVNKEYLYEMTKADWVTFNKNKITNNFMTQSPMEKQETDNAIFNDFMENLFELLLKGYITVYKHKNPGVSVKKGQITTLKKLYLISVGLLFCRSKNITKIGLLYNLFLDENGSFARSNELDYFLFFLFVIPSTASLNVMHRLGNKYLEQLGSLSRQDFNRLNDSFEVKDIERLMETFYKEFFKGEDKLSKRVYDQRFANSEFGWIFSPNGIRSYLETYGNINNNINYNNV